MRGGEEKGQRLAGPAGGKTGRLAAGLHGREGREIAGPLGLRGRLGQERKRRMEFSFSKYVSIFLS